MANIKQYKVYENQSWADISIHLFGVADYSYQLAFENKSSVMSEIKAGTVINYNADNAKQKLVLLSLAENNSIPATAIDKSQNAEPEGIGYWIIERNFKVS